MRQTFEDHADPSFGAKHLPLIRKAMAARGLDGLLVPHEDEHQNEYLPAANDRLAWATGFTGSAGAAVILKDAATLFVDGRYTLQARDQVDPALFQVRDLIDGGRVGLSGERRAQGLEDRLRPAPAFPRRRGEAEGRRRKGRRRADPCRAQSPGRGLGRRASGPAPGAGGSPPP